MQFKEIPQSWLIGGLGVCMVGMRFMGIDSWTTAALGSLLGYFTGRHIVQSGTIAPPTTDNSSNTINVSQSPAAVAAPSAPIAG